MSFKRALIIYNPTSGRPGNRARQVSLFQQQLATHNIDAVAEPTTGPHDATRLARAAVASGAYDLLIVHGGDGTINEVLQGMVGSNLPLAIWPGGTANVLARDLRLPFKAERAARVIARGKCQRVTVGRAGDRYFFLMAGIGLDASIVNRVNYALKRRTGLLAYWVAGVKHLFNWRPEQFTMKIAGAEYPATFAAIGNSQSYGGGIKITPLARLDEECLDVCIFSTKSRLQYLQYLVRCYTGKSTHEMPGVIYLKADQVEAASVYAPLVQVDGELLGHKLPMNFTAVPDAVTLVVP